MKTLDKAIALQRLLAIVAFFSMGAAAQTNTAVSEFWEQSKIAGQPSGYYHERVERNAAGEILTTMETDVVINRLGSKVEIKSDSQYREAPDGKFLGVKSEVSSSKQSVEMEVTPTDNSLLVKTTSGGKSYDRELAVTGTVVGPEAVRQLTLAKLQAPGDKLSYQIFLPQVSAVVTVTRTFIGRDTVNLVKNSQNALKLEEVNSAIPGQDTTWLDAEGRLLRDIAESPFGEIENIRSTREQAQQSTVETAPLPAEAFGRTVINANVRLPHDRLVQQVKLRITHHKPELGWPDFSADNQTVIEKTADRVILEVHRPEPTGHASRPVASNPALAAYLNPNPLIQSDNTEVQRIAQEVAGNEHDLLRAAQALQAWTAAHMQFDAGIAIAPASEVVRDRRGTCLGYAILLSSLSRAAGIPTRIRMGYVYAAGAWGGHAWVEVLDGQQWIPLDAALYAPYPADAVRFSVMTSSLDSGTISETGELAKLYGNIDIQILEYTVDGRTVTVADDAKPFTIEGNTYSNPWLGVSITKPDGFEFRKLDEGWPNLAIVTMESVDHQTIELMQAEIYPSETNDPLGWYLQQMEISGTRSERKVAGERAVELAAGDKAAVVLSHDGELWMLKASGPKTAQRIDQVAPTLKFVEGR